MRPGDHWPVMSVKHSGLNSELEVVRLGLVKAIRADITDEASSQQWMDFLISQVPGTVGFGLRRRIMGARLRSAGSGLMIYPGARIYGAASLTVGRDCRIGFDNMIQANGGIDIGDDVLLGPGVKIWSVNHVSTRLDVPIWDQGYEHKSVSIGSGVWIGADSFIMPGAQIGDHVVIAAGSVVGAKGVEPYSILAGNPARRIGTRLDRAAAELATRA